MRYICILMFVTSCALAKPIETKPKQSDEIKFVLQLTMETAKGEETVFVGMKRIKLCNWARDKIKKYGYLGHVKAVGSCTEGSLNEL